MKYLCFSHCSMLGGAELAFVELVRCLSKKDEVVVSVPNLDGPLVARLKDIGIQDLIANEYSLWMQQEFTLKRKVKCFFRILKSIKEFVKM